MMLGSSVLPRLRVRTIRALAAALFVPTLAFAQAFPNQSIKWIVPYPPGGGSDVVARAVGAALASALGQSVAIDNRPGAATQIGAEAVARAKPDGYTIGTADSGTLAFNPSLYAKLPYDPAKEAPAVQDILGGQIDLMFIDLATGLQHINAGKLRAIAVASPARLAILPGVPTIAESGVPGYEAFAWQAVVAPAGTPPEVVARLNQELVKVLRSDETKKKFFDLGVEPTPTTPGEIADYSRTEAARWSAVIKAAGIKLE